MLWLACDMTNAFIGISLDSKAFTRSWVRSALPYVLAHHRQILLMLADQLFVYTRAARWASKKVYWGLDDANRAAEELAGQRDKFFRHEIARLESKERDRVALVRWSTYSDTMYCSVWRRLWLAYSVLSGFKRAVDEVAMDHTARATASTKVTPNHSAVSVVYILDELAMSIRVTELGGYHYEYHPSPDLSIATDLYAGKFRDEGLSIEGLAGAQRHRKFTCLREVPLMPSADASPMRPTVLSASELLG